MNRDLFFEHIAQTSDEPIGIEVVRAEGIYLYGAQGERWIDFISGICVNNVGHGAPEVLAAIREQSERYLHPMVYGEAILSPQVTYAARLVQALDSRLQVVYFLNCGAEAVEGALKVAKKYTGRTGFVSCYNAYHGSTHGALSLTDPYTLPVGYGPLLPGVTFMRYNCPEDLALITDQTAAVVVDAIQAAGGIVVPDAGYLQAVRQRCDETGALMILDEIQTGFGRMGTLFAHLHYGVEPDILLLGKALGGGMPMGAFVTRPEIIDIIRRDPVLGHITTFGGHPVCCAAGLAAFDKIIRERLTERVPALEAILLARLRHPAILRLTGKGLLYGITLDTYKRAEAVREAALRRGLVTIGFLNGGVGLRIAPPLVITPEEMHAACDILLAALDEVYG
ncbi:MAG: aspartate aminotransferase family protein [Bacteroidia bacterium]|nr:aspartate aminotransferase family protein [Bacteroidia bacterium]